MDNSSLIAAYWCPWIGGFFCSQLCSSVCFTRSYHREGSIIRRTYNVRPSIGLSQIETLNLTLSAALKVSAWSFRRPLFIKLVPLVFLWLDMYKPKSICRSIRHRGTYQSFVRVGLVQSYREILRISRHLSLDTRRPRRRCQDGGRQEPPA